MAKKKDPSITFLNKFGYYVVKAPRVGIEPMGIIGKDDATPRCVWTSTVSEPAPAALQFGFIVQGIQRENDVWKLKGVQPSGDIAFGVRAQPSAAGADGSVIPSPAGFEFSSDGLHDIETPQTGGGGERSVRVRCGVRDWRITGGRLARPTRPQTL